VVPERLTIYAGRGGAGEPRSIILDRRGLRAALHRRLFTPFSYYVFRGKATELRYY
jgi:hypothetical protein